MESSGDLTNQNPDELSAYILLSEFRKPLINLIIKSVDLPNGSTGLDAGCGIGAYTSLLAKAVGLKGAVVGLDISEEFISYANKNKRENTQFEIGDINSLDHLESESFDWIWSTDTVWPGPKELGCSCKKPKGIVDGFYRLLKPRGDIFLLFWTSHKFLPGYPLLEAKLNTSTGATAPFVSGMHPMDHIMSAKNWLVGSGFKGVLAKTYVSDINGPLDQNTRKALQILFQMFWGEAEDTVSKEDWNEYKKLTNPNSRENILDRNHYYGFYTYSLFKGVK